MFDAALFDFDGTLAESESLHRLAFSKVLGKEISVEEWETKCVGTPPPKLMVDLLPESRKGENVDELLSGRIFEKWVDEGARTAGRRDLSLPSRAGYKVCRRVLGQPLLHYQALQRLGLLNFFEIIVAGDDDVMRLLGPLAAAP